MTGLGLSPTAGMLVNVCATLGLPVAKATNKDTPIKTNPRDTTAAITKGQRSELDFCERLDLTGDLVIDFASGWRDASGIEPCVTKVFEPWFGSGGGYCAG